MIYIFLAEGFEEVEALTPLDILRRAKLPVKTVGVTGKTVTGSHGIPVVADLTIDEVQEADLSAVVLPGGIPGTPNLEACDRVMQLVDYAAENDMVVAAICAAPSILGHRGILKGKRATCFPGFEKELTGAEHVDLPAVQDGNVVTGWGAGGAFEFSLALLSALTDGQTAEKIRASMRIPDVAHKEENE